MEDKFLYKLRGEPSRRFVMRLKSKLDASPMQEQSRISISRSAWVTALVILLVISSALLSVPSVRAAVVGYIIKVSTQTFEVAAEHPGSGLNPVTVDPSLLSFEQASQAFADPIKVPSITMAPDYQLNEDQVVLYLNNPDFPDRIIFDYKAMQEDAPKVTLTIIRFTTANSEVVGTQRIEEIPISQGKTAALVKGGWLENTQSWEDLDVYSLTWQDNGLTYKLQGPDKNVLISMANQIVDE